MHINGCVEKSIRDRTAIVAWIWALVSQIESVEMYNLCTISISYFWFHVISFLAFMHTNFIDSLILNFLHVYMLLFYVMAPFIPPRVCLAYLCGPNDCDLSKGY